MSIEPASTLSCVVCGVSGDIKLKRCAKCKSAVYCSRDHQVLDWPSHKKVCGKSDDLPEHDRVPVKVNIHKTDVSMTSLKNEHEKTLSEGLNAEKEKNSTHQEPSGTVFDKRPFKRKCFVQPKSFTIDTVAEFVVENLLTNNYCVVDGLFDKGHLIETIWEIQSLDTSLKPGMLAGGKTSGDNKKKVVDVEIRNDKIMWLDCNGLCQNKEVSNIEKVVSKMDEITSACNKFLEVTGQCLINGRTKAMVACYPGNGSFYKRHVDNPSKDGRKITCILYLNPEWDVTKNGGLLRIFSQDYSDYVDIPPLLNRMLFFWSDGRNPHEVQPAFKNRYAITVWYFDEIERKLAKEAAIKSDIAKIAGEIALVDVRYKEKEKLLLEERIDIEARKAIKSLSEEELMAIGSMIKGQQNQKAILEQLGINDNIQKYLLQTLKERGFV